MRYPAAEWVPWKAEDSLGRPTCYAGLNKPAAIVLHIMAGYASTARRWAVEGHFGASWHYTVARDGHVMQHLEHRDGGYHAGIAASQAAAAPPRWQLWRGPDDNVNHYTLGIEHEGFPGEPFPPAQAAASRGLCRWLSRELRIPLDRAHFPAHADIDIQNRPNDFNTPALREQFYAYLFEEEVMTEDHIRRIVREELDPVMASFTDERLRQVMAAREALRRLASHPDAALVAMCLAELRKAGLAP